MNLFELTRALVDIDSTTGHEQPVADYLFAHLSPLAAKYNARLDRQPAEPGRDNLFLPFPHSRPRLLRRQGHHRRHDLRR